MLTEDQVRAIYAESMKHRDPVPYIHRAIEAAVLAELAKQEPVAHVVDRENCRVWWNDRYTHISQAPKNDTPLYAAPVVQPDMVLVPREPTEAIRHSMMSALVGDGDWPVSVYKAAIDAAMKDK